MAMIYIPVNVLDEKCADCQCMDLDQLKLYGGFEGLGVQYSCKNIHMCQYIRNRLIRKNRDEVISKEVLRDDVGNVVDQYIHKIDKEDETE